MKDIFNFIRSEDLGEVKVVLSSNPEVVNSKDSRGFTPLLLASYYGFEDITKEILKYSPDIDRKDGSGNTH